jgi:Na+/proline symporter
MTLHPLDLAVVLGYLAITLGLGFAMRKQSSREEFFAAGRSMGRITVGLSVMATLFSANSFVMYPSAAYSNSLRVGMALVAFWMMAPVVVWVFIPVYSKLNCRTAYEYLEMRFHVSVRCLASALFILLRIAWMAAATYAASVAISGISGIGQYVIIISLGAVAIAYTMLGGLRAVMWTDVLQFFVFAGTIVFALGLLISQSEGGVSGIMSTYFADRDNLLFDFSLDPTVQFGTIAILLGSFLEGLSAFGADQVAVQRYIAAKDARTSQWGFGINLLGMAVVLPGLLLIGMGLFSFFHQQPGVLVPVLLSELQDPQGDAAQKHAVFLASVGDSGDSQEGTGAPDMSFEQKVNGYYQNRPDQVRADMLRFKLQDQALSQFVRMKFPPGVVGLLVAALMAATMSSIDSGIHSVTTAVIIDFRDRLFPHLRPKTDAGEMLSARCLVLIIGALAITLACFVGQLGDVFTVAKKTVGAFAAPLLAVFVLGLFIPRARTTGVFFGTWIGAAFTLWWMNQNPDWFAMWFFPVGFFGSVGLALVLSMLPLPGNEPTDGPSLTFWEVKRRPPRS